MTDKELLEKVKKDKELMYLIEDIERSKGKEAIWIKVKIKDGKIIDSVKEGRNLTFK